MTKLKKAVSILLSIVLGISTLFVGTGAFAQTYVPGDANGDGVCDVSDIRAIVLALIDGTTDKLADGDFNCDGKINSLDSWDLMHFIANGQINPPTRPSTTTPETSYTTITTYPTTTTTTTTITTSPTTRKDHEEWDDFGKH